VPEQVKHSPLARPRRVAAPSRQPPHPRLTLVCRFDQREESVPASVPPLPGRGGTPAASEQPETNHRHGPHPRAAIPAQGPRHVVWLIQGTAHTTVRLWELCHFCGEDALTELPAPLLRRQLDGTTIVCHPSLGGCNRGHARVDEKPTARRRA